MSRKSDTLNMIDICHITWLDHTQLSRIKASDPLFPTAFLREDRRELLFDRIGFESWYKQHPVKGIDRLLAANFLSGKNRNDGASHDN